MGPQKRQRRAMVRREVAPEAQPKRPTRKQTKPVEKPQEQEPGTPRPRRRRTGPNVPGWKAAGLEPRTEEES
ncbi:hypothetical protein ACKI1I_35790 [Streptomyces turgidiscabies]|uniref:hypothetical protein n=1 Tax=Streptomyces turgidiscabies TaxID=85558 RepID=UPI0038F719CC